jgi:hypothetical protein
MVSFPKESTVVQIEKQQRCPLLKVLENYEVRRICQTQDAITRPYKKYLNF